MVSDGRTELIRAAADCLPSLFQPTPTLLLSIIIVFGKVSNKKQL